MRNIIPQGIKDITLQILIFFATSLKDYAIPICAILLTYYIHRQSEIQAENQIKMSNKQFDNDLQSKYLEIFYNDLTSKDSITRINSVSLLRLMNDSLAQKLRKWISENPTLSPQIKALAKLESKKAPILKEVFSNNRIYSESEIKGFFIRVEIGYIEAVNRYLNAKFPVNLLDENGETPMVVVIRNGDFQLFKLLVSRGADIKQVNKNGYNLLHQVVNSTDKALNQGHIQIASWLLNHDFDVREPTPDRDTPLTMAIPYGETADDRVAYELIKVLLLAGADPCIQHIFSYRGTTPRIVMLLKSIKSDCNK